jgi:hypothetical protein
VQEAEDSFHNMKRQNEQLEKLGMQVYRVMDVEKVKVLGMCEVRSMRRNQHKRPKILIFGDARREMITDMGWGYYSLVRLFKDSLLEYSTISEGSPRKILTI